MTIYLSFTAISSYNFSFVNYIINKTYYYIGLQFFIKEIMTKEILAIATDSDDVDRCYQKDAS